MKAADDTCADDQPEGLVELGIIASLPERLASTRPDGAGGYLLTLRPGASSSEMVAAVMLLPPDVVWVPPRLRERDETLHLMFMQPGPAGG